MAFALEKVGRPELLAEMLRGMLLVDERAAVAAFRRRHAHRYDAAKAALPPDRPD